MARAIASIEARMTSTRLPGKVLADIGGAPALTRLVERLKRAERLDGMVLATTTGADDDVLAEWADDNGIPCHRGSEDDVLGRVVEAQQTMDSTIVVEVCGDTPLLDPAVIDLALEAYEADRGDLITTARHASFPQGIDAEVFSLADLEEVAGSIDDPAVREHVSLYFYDHPERYRIHDLEAPAGWRAPDKRLVLDYPEDLELIRSIYQRLEPDYGDEFNTGHILSLFNQDPALSDINRHCEERAPR